MTSGDFNASQAAKRIGISDRTIRRWLKPDKHGKVKLPSIRTESGQLAIAAADVELLRQEVEEERTRFVTPTHAYATARQEMPTHDIGQSVGHDIDIEQRLASMAQSIANLNATIDIQSRRINELTKRVAELEARNVPTQPVPPSTTADTISQAKPPKQPSDTSSPIPTDLPHGTLSAVDFAKHVGLKYTILEGTIRHGMALGRGKGKDYLEITERHSRKYLTLEQQSKAIELLTKHGKISPANHD
jgi:chromosome segregation ATPase